MAVAQITCAQKKTDLCVIPCEKCGNDNEEDFTFLEGTGDLSDCVACKRCGKKSLQLYYDDEASDNEQLKTKESKACINDNDMDRYQAESIGSSSQNYKDEMKKNLEEQNNTEQPVLRCLTCNATDEQQFIKMLDSEGCLAWWKCITCNEEYNQNGRMEPGTNQFKLRPCSSCQADDPNHFIIKECAVSKDIVLECGWCEVIHQTLVKARRPEVTDVTCECGNKKQDCFRIDEDAHGNITNIMCLVCDKNQDYKNESPVTCTECKNCDPDQFELIDNDLGKTKAVICHCCNSQQTVDKDTQLILTPVYRKESFLDKEKVTSPNQLKMGDHIAFHRKIGYWHHAIVVEVDDLSGRMKLIEYTKLKLKKGIKRFKYHIQERWRDPIDWVKDAVYCIRYWPDKCLSADDVVKRARTRIGEMTYNLLTNNCEHFAIWAKTGKNASFQVQEYAKITATAGTQWIVGGVLNLGGYAARQTGHCMVAIKMPALWSNATHCAGVAGLSVLDAIPCGIMVVVEGIHTGYKIYKGAKDKKAKLKAIDESELTEEEKIEERKKVQHEFKEKVVDNVTQALWQTACFLGGYLLVQILIPVPILGGVLGGFLGAVLGTLTRQKIGEQAVKRYNKTTTTQSEKIKSSKNKCTIS